MNRVLEQKSFYPWFLPSQEGPNRLFDASGNLINSPADAVARRAITGNSGGDPLRPSDTNTKQEVRIKFLDPDANVTREGDVYVCSFKADCKYSHPTIAKIRNHIKEV